MKKREGGGLLYMYMQMQEEYNGAVDVTVVCKCSNTHQTQSPRYWDWLVGMLIDGVGEFGDDLERLGLVSLRGRPCQGWT